MSARTIALLGVSLLLVACGPRSHSPARAVAKTPTPTAIPAPAATDGPPRIDVVAVGAAPSPTGTVAFVVVRNANAMTAASEVTVTVTAASTNEFAAVTATATLASLNPGATGAVSIGIAVPNGDQVAQLTARAVSKSRNATPATPITTSAPQFHQDPIRPFATLSLQSDVASNADLVVVCNDTHGAILGGGSLNQIALNGGVAQSVSLTLSLRDTPSRCSGYATAV